MFIRSSKAQHPLLRSIGLQCSNYQCGFTARGIVEITHEISPSAIPNPKVKLLTTKEILLLKAANDGFFNENL